PRTLSQVTFISRVYYKGIELGGASNGVEIPSATLKPHCNSLDRTAPIYRSKMSSERTQMCFELCQCITHSRLFQSQDLNDPFVRAGKLDWDEISAAMNIIRGPRGEQATPESCRATWKWIAYGHIRREFGHTDDADSDTEAYLQPFAAVKGFDQNSSLREGVITADPSEVAVKFGKAIVPPLYTDVIQGISR
ncbi:hypothetical protein B484DRAFT_289782, partial [Ochromonadaceae sp. CCMP2298]